MITLSCIFAVILIYFTNMLMAYNDIKEYQRSDHTTNWIALPPKTVETFAMHSIIGSWYEVYHSANIGEVWGGITVDNRTCIQATFKHLTARRPTRAHFLSFQLNQNTTIIWNGILTRRVWETAEGRLILQEKGIEASRRFHIYIVAFETSHPGYFALSDPLGIHMQVFSRLKQFSVSQQSRVLRRELKILGFTQEWNKARLTLHDNCT